MFRRQDKVISIRWHSKCQHRFAMGYQDMLRKSLGAKNVRPVLIGTLLVGMLRLSVFWFLTIKLWMHSQSLADLPLLILLYPDLVILPQTSGQITLWSAVLMSITLCVTSAIYSFIIVSLLRGRGFLKP